MTVKTLTTALLIGTAITLALFGLGYVAAEAGAMRLSYGLYWQAWALYQLLPCTDINPLCESRRAGMIVFYAGIPVGIAVYSLAAWAVLAWRRRQKPVAA